MGIEEQSTLKAITDAGLSARVIAWNRHQQKFAA